MVAHPQRSHWHNLLLSAGVHSAGGFRCQAEQCLEGRGGLRGKLMLLVDQADSVVFALGLAPAPSDVMPDEEAPAGEAGDGR